MTRYIEHLAPDVARNAVGYAQAMPEGAWVVTDGIYPIRVHNGFAVFTTQRQAAWCAEMMNGAFEDGKRAARANIRAALGIGEDE